MAYLDNRIIEKQTLNDTELLLTEENLNFLGPELVLQRCRVIVRATARHVLIRGVAILDCQIDVKRKLVNFQDWCGAVIKDCKFIGQFKGNDFGHWPDVVPSSPSGSIEKCDFSEAILESCRFMDCDISSITLPRWPSFAILDPVRRRREIEAFPWPAPLRVWASVVADELDITCASVDYAPALAKRAGCTEAEIQGALERFGGVLM